MSASRNRLCPAIVDAGAFRWPAAGSRRDRVVTGTSAAARVTASVAIADFRFQPLVSLRCCPFWAENRGWLLSADAGYSMIFEVVFSRVREPHAGQASCSRHPAGRRKTHPPPPAATVVVVVPLAWSPSPSPPTPFLPGPGDLGCRRRSPTQCLA
jgi:hypothetical protein